MDVMLGEDAIYFENVKKALIESFLKAKYPCDVISHEIDAKMDIEYLIYSMKTIETL